MEFIVNDLVAEDHLIGPSQATKASIVEYPINAVVHDVDMIHTVLPV